MKINAKDFALIEDKVRYTVNFGLAPHFASILEKDLFSSYNGF